MLNEKEWMESRKEIFEKNKYANIIEKIIPYWFICFILAVAFYDLSQYLNGYVILILWIGPIVLLPKLFPKKNVPDSDIIAYHLYNIAYNLDNYDELSMAEKEMNSSLKILDKMIINSETYDRIFTKNIEETLYKLSNNLERLNTYIKDKTADGFNKNVASAVKSIADSIKKDSSKITDEFSNSIEELGSYFDGLKPTEISMPYSKKIY